MFIFKEGKNLTFFNNMSFSTFFAESADIDIYFSNCVLVFYLKLKFLISH